MEANSLRSQVIERIKTRQAEWDALLAEIPQDRMELPGVEGNWSVKDLVVHLAHYENWLATFLESVLQDRPFEKTPLDRLELDDRNESIFQANRARPLAEALSDARLARERLLRAVEALAEEDFEPDSRFAEPMAANPPPWEKNGVASLKKLIAGETYRHYEAHMPALKLWLEKA